MGRSRNIRWFVPAKAMRLGIRPASWQGVVICLFFVGSLLGAFFIPRSLSQQLVGALVLVIAFSIIAYLSGGRPNNTTLD